MAIAGGVMLRTCRVNSSFQAPGAQNAGKSSFDGVSTRELNFTDVRVCRLAPAQGAADPVPLFLD